MRIVNPHLSIYGARGVPNGLVDAQIRGYGSTPWRPHSRMMRDDPMITDTMFPHAESAIKKFKAREALTDPKTAEKNDEAASCFDPNSSAFGTR